VQPTNLEEMNRGLPLGAGEHQDCRRCSLSESCGPNASARWSAESVPEQSGSGIATRSESLENLERSGREVPEGHAPERDGERRGERAKRKRQRRRVRHGRMVMDCILDGLDLYLIFCFLWQNS